jgi:Transposase DDE domain
MHKTSHKKGKWERHKEVSINWKHYDKSRLCEYKKIMDLTPLLHELDKPIHRREFKLSTLTILLMFKIFFGLSCRSMASTTKDPGIYKMLGMKRVPCYKTIQNTFRYLDVRVLAQANRLLVPTRTLLAGVDSSGMKTQRKGAWIEVRFHHYMRTKDFKKIHIFVDLISKKILYCTMTQGKAHDSRQLLKILRHATWIKVEIILGDGGYDTKECFHAITRYGALPGIKLRKNSTTKAYGCPSRRRAVIAQQQDMDKWKQDMKTTMRCIIEVIFSGTKRRFGEYLFSVKARFQRIEVWLRTLLWNVIIYPR